MLNVLLIIVFILLRQLQQYFPSLSLCLNLFCTKERQIKFKFSAIILKSGKRQF